MEPFAQQLTLTKLMRPFSIVRLVISIACRPREGLLSGNDIRQYYSRVKRKVILPSTEGNIISTRSSGLPIMRISRLTATEPDLAPACEGDAPVAAGGSKLRCSRWLLVASLC